ncbi:hypothetical protein HMPREF2681_01675 [Corynebacterium sp. HMSC064H12]|uniref:hypothetical protein n=1 Tax=Corynebacterium sp. HMSC064H12 TaxID=1715160 RepID=UPI0008A3201B|nr:hypothetical protein [Corynebacterium sp. HMSC064H12]OFM53054.1 hypothetical protein HMPREF2681_01675 [Corynebacterium sp. HMSC064H12]
MSQHDDLFDLVDACDLRVPDKRTFDERPDLLELYTRRPRRIEPRGVKWDWAATALCLTFGTLIFMALVMCL